MSSKHTKPPDESDDNEYEAEAILTHKHIGTARSYFVKWKGFPDSENWWVGKRKMACKDLINEYEQREQGKSTGSLVYIPSSLPSAASMINSKLTYEFVECHEVEKVLS